MNIYRCETCKYNDNRYCEVFDYRLTSSEIDTLEVFGCASHSKLRDGDVMKDITAPAFVQIQIKKDSKVVWINTENGCQFRACQIKFLEVNDHRINKSECEQDDCRV